MTVGIPIAREQARVAEPRCMLDTLAGLHAWFETVTRSRSG